MPESWEKQPDESEPAFAAFRIYRDLEQGQRSITRVAQECTKERSLIARWSSRHSWQQRVADWDAYLDQQRRDSHVEAVIEMHKRHAQIALRGQSKALEWLEQLTPEQLRHGIGVRLLAEATKLERLARGANTEELGMTADVTVGPSRTLGELFQVPQGMTELELARVVVERATRPEGSFGPDGDGLVDDGLVASDPEDDPDDTDPAEAWPAAAAVPDLPEPEREPEPDPEPEVDPVAAQVAAYLNTLGPITDRERKTIGADFRARLEERPRHLFAAGNLRLDPDAASAGKDPDRRAPRPPPRPASSHVTLVPSEELELLRQGIDPRATEGR